MDKADLELNSGQRNKKARTSMQVKTMSEDIRIVKTMDKVDVEVKTVSGDITTANPKKVAN